MEKVRHKMATYELDHSVLRVRGDLSPEDHRRFQEWCDRFVASDAAKVTIDLTDVPRITSSCIGVISAVWVDLVAQDRSMELVISPQVRRVFTMAGFHHVFDLRGGDAPKRQMGNQEGAP